MKSCIGHITGVTSELTPFGIYFSAADQMSQHPILNINGEIVHGGWYFEGESCLFLLHYQNISCETSYK